ncbi:MAG: nucleoside triphosphate pyrophosphohydrolase [Candidatus Latescibacteria bacterium]|jgi:tetrapyrrole methylase family protein / MazG family protein|nr:nucleoside triphosphate pyrophosphohydrolase [Candidatus Latescibacterota bacterium]MBT4139889.1 nucleoside triphosphate pyrophosphohydrolase [Candidatus Latescibacterota bacterium]MBT5832795.1 nucleoside triphosphate pyrophosphohydrolase [Candidatus Latescibacterota bacterium]
MSNLDRLIEIMQRLRGPDGCPWDKEQTQETLKPYLIEEAYEAIDAIDSRNDKDITDELGDVLLQVVFHSQIASETGRFTFDEVAKSIADKLVRRHPHVFGDVVAETSDQVVKNWEAIKAEEQKERKKDDSILSGVPRHLPALLRAAQIQKKATKVGFDWEKTEEVLDKVEEEIKEFRNASTQQDKQEEFGDMLFSLVNLARFLRIDPEDALTQTIAKFQNRFTFIEEALRSKGQTPQNATLEEMDALWEKAKNALNQ